MNPKPKITVEELAATAGLALEYTDKAPANFGAQLEPGPNPTCIVVNGTHPVYEQRFFIARELGRYALARQRPTRPPFMYALVNRQYRNHFMKGWMRYSRRLINRQLGPERRRIDFALGLLLMLGHATDLQLYLEKHPEMKKWAYYFAFVVVLKGMKQRLMNTLQKAFLLTPVVP